MAELLLDVLDATAKLDTILAVDVVPAAMALEAQPALQAGAHAVVDPAEAVCNVSLSPKGGHQRMLTLRRQPDRRSHKGA